MQRQKRAFTLIELLVVIAIIAILAAILFPVFAQAKRAAKGSVALSGAKQMDLGQLMYTNDADDQFSPTVEYQGGWSVAPFSYLQQPYMKSWGVLVDPTGPPVTDLNGNSQQDWTVYGYWGMPPRKEATTGDFSSYEFGKTTAGKNMTGGEVWVYDGIGGAGIDTTAAAWSDAGYKKGGTPSLSSSSVANPSDQVMMAQSGTWDFMWQQDNADAFDLYYSGCGSNLYGCNFVTTAPVARFRDSGGAAAGISPWPGAQPTQEPTGLTAWAGVDGHVKATPWRKLMGETILVNGGTQKAIKAFWPSGS